MLRAEKEASEAEKEAFERPRKEPRRRRPRRPRAPFAGLAKAASGEELQGAELAKTEAALSGAEAQCEATRADVYERACTLIDETDYVQNRTRAAKLCIVGEDCDDDDVLLDLMGAVEAKGEELWSKSSTRLTTSFSTRRTTRSSCPRRRSWPTPRGS